MWLMSKEKSAKKTTDMDDNHKRGYYKNDAGYFLHVT